MIWTHRYQIVTATTLRATKSWGSTEKYCRETGWWNGRDVWEDFGSGYCANKMWKEVSVYRQNREDLIFEKGWGAEKINYSSAYVRITVKACFSLLLALISHKSRTMVWTGAGRI